MALQEETLDVAHIPDVTSLHIVPLCSVVFYLPVWSGTDRRGPPEAEDMWLLVLLSLLQCASAYDVDLKKLEGLGLAKARVEVTV